MDLFDAIILGLIQGITEFLPISSDGHLVIADVLLPGGLTGTDALGFDILLHAGSLLAILIGFRDVWIALVRGLFARNTESWRTVGLLIVATIPGVIAGLLLHDMVSGELRTLLAAAVGFLVTAACLIVGESIARMNGVTAERTTFLGALLIGIAQAVAVLPGISRSGLTVSMGRALGLKREAALDFSFLMALPIIGGAVLKTLLDVQEGSVVFPALPVSLAGFAVSAVTSVCAILFLRRFVRLYSFSWFAWYLIPVALLLLGEYFGLRTMFNADQVREEVRSIGAIAVFAFALIEVVPPFSFFSPGIIALVIAGSMAPDVSSIILFIAAAATASFVGNAGLFIAGRIAGPSLTKSLRLTPETRARAERFIGRAGMWAIVGGQFVGPLRPTMSFVAAMLNMHPATFFTASLLAALLWGTSAVGIGYLFSSDAVLVASVIGGVGVVTFAGFAVVLVWEWLFVRRHRRSQMKK